LTNRICFGILQLVFQFYYYSTEKDIALEKRHENSLKDLLETVACTGFASVPKWKITRWYGQSNFTVAIRRDLRERWKTLIEDELEREKTTLRLAEIGGNIVLMKKTDFFPDKE
jgi:hypothetical protein